MFNDVDTDGDGTPDKRVLGDFNGDGTLEFVEDICAGIKDFCDHDGNGVEDRLADLNGDGTLVPSCGTIEILPGNYQTTPGNRTCRLTYQGLTVRAQAPDVVISARDISCDEVAAATSEINIFEVNDNCTDGVASKSRLAIDGLTIIGPGARFDNDSACYINRPNPVSDCSAGHWCPAQRVNGFYIYEYNDVTLTNNRVIGMDAQAFTVSGCTNVVFNGNRAVGAGEHLFYVGRGDGVIVTNNLGEHGGHDCMVWDPISFATPRNNLVSGNVCKDTLIGFQVESYGGLPGPPIADSIVSNNVFVGSPARDWDGDGAVNVGAGLLVQLTSGQTAKNLSFKNNVFSNWSGGCASIRSDDPGAVQYVEFRGNSLSNCTTGPPTGSAAAMYAAGTSGMIAGNDIFDTNGDGTLSADGIDLSGPGRWTVTGNRIAGFSNNGILVRSDRGPNTDVLIQSNQIIANTSILNGVLTDTNASDIRVTGNTIAAESIDWDGTEGLDPASVGVGVFLGGPGSSAVDNAISDVVIRGLYVAPEASGALVKGNNVSLSSPAASCVLTYNNARTVIESTTCTGPTSTTAAYKETGTGGNAWISNTFNGASFDPSSLLPGSSGTFFVTDSNGDGTANDSVFTFANLKNVSLVNGAGALGLNVRTCGASECLHVDMNNNGIKDGGDICLLGTGVDTNCDGTAEAQNRSDYIPAIQFVTDPGYDGTADVVFDPRRQAVTFDGNNIDESGWCISFTGQCAAAMWAVPKDFVANGLDGVSKDLEVELVTSPVSGTGGVVLWNVSMNCAADGNRMLDKDRGHGVNVGTTGSVQYVGDSVSKYLRLVTIPGSNLSSIVKPGSYCWILVSRLDSSPRDTYTGDVRLHGVRVRYGVRE